MPSLLAQHLTDALRAQLADARSPYGARLSDIIASGTAHPDSNIGVYAADAESYAVFGALLDPIIEAYHGQKLGQAPAADFRPLGAEHAFDDDRIVTTRIRVARNLAGMAFGGVQSVDSRLDMVERVAAVLEQLEQPHAGTLRHLGDIPRNEQAQMRAEHRLFQQGDRFLRAAGLNRDWPLGRAAFESADGLGMVWLGEEDHLRIMTLMTGGDLPAAFARLAALVDAIGSALPFAWSPTHGHLASCPTNLGTGMRASVHVRLLGLGADPDALSARAEELRLQVRGTHGEHTKSVGGVFDVSNAARLGLTEREAVVLLATGLRTLLDEDSAALG